MKKLIIAVLFIMLAIPSVSYAWSSWNVGFSGGNYGYGGGSAMSVNFAGGHRGHRGMHGGMHRGMGHRSVGYRGMQGGMGHRGGYYERPVYRTRHIHRQAGRVYYQGSCLPVVVVPSGVMYGY